MTRCRAVPSRSILRALVLPVVALICVLQASAASAQWPRTVTDIAGREVDIPSKPQRILLAEGFQILALSFVSPDPVSLLAGWGGDLRTFDPATYALVRDRFPDIENVPTTGMGSGETFSLERALALDPDLVVFSLWQARGNLAETAAPFEAAGIPVVFIDFYLDPLANTLPSLDLLGRILGEEQRAREYAAFYRERLDFVKKRLAAETVPRPKVLLHAFPEVWPCCWSAGGRGVGELIDLVGGRNIGAERFPSPNGGQLNLEVIIEEDPEVYIATGSSGTGPGVALGAGVTEDEARSDLARVIGAPGLSSLSAVVEGRVHGLWNFFNGSPINILAVEVMAKWVHPELFGTLDPGKTLAEINDRFSAVPFRGAFWVDLVPGAMP